MGGRAVERIARRPLLFLLCLGVVFVATQAWWNAGHRHLGAFNVDEEGGLAAAYRFHRVTGLDPTPLVREVFSTWNGPLVPLLAVPIMLVGPDSVATTMAVQSVLVVLAAIGTAGAVLHIAGRRAAVLAGAVMMWLPVSIVSVRSFQYSTGVAAFLGLALWALLASDGGRRLGPMVAFGASAGAMTLCRTMSAAFLPALGAAGLIVVLRRRDRAADGPRPDLPRDRRRLLHLAAAGVTTLGVAGPWWWVEWDNIIGYLSENAYGPRARYWGSVAWGDRISDHVDYFVNDFRALVLVGWFATAASLLAIARWWWIRRTRRDDPDRPVWHGRPHLLVAVAVAGVLCRIALLSTSNLGFWFAYPLDTTIVAGVVGLAAIAPRRTTGTRPAPRWRTGAAVAAVVVLILGSITSLGADAAGALDEGDWRWAVLADHGALQGGNLEADARLESTDDAVGRAVAAEWWRAGTRLATEIDRIGRRNGTIVQTIVGEIHLMNANTVALAEEVTGRGIYGLEVVNTLEPPDAELRRDLRPTRDGVTRVLVIVTGRSLGFPNGRGRERFIRLAVEEGWRREATVALPDGGDVGVWIHGR